MGKPSEADMNELLPMLENKANEVMMELKDFQRETVLRIDRLYGSGQDRVLVADEVGLGKTMIAKGVLANLAVRRCKEGDDLFKVTYICSNQTIAMQNLSKLDIYHTGYDDITETRLSMQHLKVKQQELGLIRNASTDNNASRKYVQLIPLTPATSFRTGGDMAGTVRERALMYVVLSTMDGVDISSLEQMMKQYAKTSWDYMKMVYQSAVQECHHCDETYPACIQNQIADHKTFRQLKDFLHEEHSSYEQRQMIGELRKMFAFISIDMLNPDLVIMDEFQRFQFMLEHAEGEMSMLAERFLKSKSEKIEDKVRVLLLSATPYKLYSTLEEVGEHAQDDSYKEFLSVMHFLREDKADEFDKTWAEYSRCLQSICNVPESLEYASEQSKKAGDCMYELMCRTERLSVMNEGDFVDDSSKDNSVSVTEQDIRSYQEALRVMNAVGMGALLPVDYVKSCPYLLSFMQKYELKERLIKYFRQHPEAVDVCKSEFLWLKDRIGCKPIPIKNARYNRLQNAVLPSGKKNELLLWMPPTIPYYEPGGVFRKKEFFSKMIVFSSWEMVPRMISCLISHEVESRIATDGSLLKPRLKDEYNTTKLLYTCFPTLADAFNPKVYFKQGLLSINDVERSVHKKIEIIPPQMAELLPQGMSKQEDIWKVAVDIAIASPASCFYRITRDEQLSSELAKLFVNYLNTAEKTNIIQLATESRHNKDAHWQDVLTYCKQGNLQAVLDEYAYFIMDGKPINNKKFSETLTGALGLRTTTYSIDTFSRFKNKISGEKGNNADDKGMRSHYATAFAQGSGEKQQDRKKSLQTSFNSPFWPFVLASTSIGQEGLDFHPYCRRIMHWNLPSNPVDLEQREGRINRYKCLAIRQNIALKYIEEIRQKCSDENVWNLLFDAAEVERIDGQSQLIPYWCLGPNQQIRIERILANYPISIDQERYDRLIKVLSLYRLTMGQARQSELLEYVFKEFDNPTVLQDLYISLSPFEREKNSRDKL